MPGGFLGVDVFFVLSGYLTASIALSRRYTFREFMVRRLRRLWPLLLFVSAVVAACLAAVGEFRAIDVLPGAVFIGNLFDAHVTHYVAMSHAWTLGAEMQFYALVAILALNIDKAAFRSACLALFAAATVARFAIADAGNWTVSYYGLPHFSGLFLGATVATIPAYPVRAPGVALVISAATLCAAIVTAAFGTVAALAIWIPLAEAASAVMIVAIVAGVGRVGAPLRIAPVRRLGTLSYGVYLWHYPISVAVPDMIPPLAEFAIVVGASLPLAAVSFRLIEAPMRAGARVSAGRSSLSAEGA